jgi:hypothetical protein
MPVHTRSSKETEKHQKEEDLKHCPEIHALSSWCYYPNEHKPKPMMNNSVYTSVYHRLSPSKAELIRRIFFRNKS